MCPAGSTIRPNEAFVLRAEPMISFYAHHIYTVLGMSSLLSADDRRTHLKSTFLKNRHNTAPGTQAASIYAHLVPMLLRSQMSLEGWCEAIEFGKALPCRAPFAMVAGRGYRFEG